MRLKHTVHKKLKASLMALLTGATMKELIEICGSRSSANDMLATLENVYQVEISLSDNFVYKIESISNDNIWKVVFKGLK